MPTYQYVCDACQTEFERVQRFSDDPIRDCPSCGAPKARRRISAAGIVFKGSGWYVHDSKRVVRSAAAGPSAGKEGQPPAGGEGKGDDGAKGDGGTKGGGGAKSGGGAVDGAAASGGGGGAADGAGPKRAPAAAASDGGGSGATSGTSSPTARSAT